MGKIFNKYRLTARKGLIRYGLWVILAIVLLAFPNFSSSFWLSMVNNTLIVALAVLGLNLITGYAGVMSLGNAGFMGIGSFTAAILAVYVGIPWWLAIIAGSFAAMLIGIMIGIPALRLRGLYLLMATQAMFMIKAFAFQLFETKTHRLAGIRFPKPTVGEFTFDTAEKFYYLFLVITVLVILFVRNLLRTGMGRSLLALRDNENAARAMGVNITFAKLMAFAVSSFIIGMTGALQGVYFKNVTAEMYSFSLSMDQIVALFIGGNGSLLGPVFGAGFITLLPEGIDVLAHIIQRFLPVVGDLLLKFRFETQLFIYGLCIILVLLLKPTGLEGVFQDVRLYIRKRLQNRKTPSPKKL